MEATDAVAILTPVVEAFERIGIAYYVGGSVAAVAHGLGRSTLDVDVVADITPAQVQPLADAPRDEFYLDEQAIQDAIRRHASFNLIHLTSPYKVDVFLLKTRPFDAEAARRARRETLDEDDTAQAFNVASPEDLILAKLEWYRLGGGISDRQWTDILAVMKIQAPTLDLAYLRRWAPELAVADLLERALDDAGLTGTPPS